MTATDKAFIRIFDTNAEASHAAPHVSFAARGIQVDARPEPAAVRQAVDENATEDYGEFPSSRSPDEPAPDAGPPAGRGRQPSDRPARGNSGPAYFPSAYRGLVDVEEPPKQCGQQPPSPEYAAAVQNDARRRPISELLNEAPDERFLPALEVDGLRWSPLLSRMLRQCTGELRNLGDALETARDAGRRVILFQSTSPGAGCTTITLAAARTLAERGRSVVVVDGGFLRPQLAAAVGLSLVEGWERALLSGTPLADIVIRSLEDGLCIVPLAAPFHPQQLAGNGLSGRVATSLRTLAAHFELVLVDVGCPVESSELKQALEHIGLEVADGSVLVSSGRSASESHGGPSPVDPPQPVIGLVENFGS